MPIAAEDYSGYEARTYYAVAVARRTDSHLTVFNLKSASFLIFSVQPFVFRIHTDLSNLNKCRFGNVTQNFVLLDRRSCHSAVMTAAGWISPVDKLIETGQIKITDDDVYFNVGKPNIFSFVIKSIVVDSTHVPIAMTII